MNRKIELPCWTGLTTEDVLRLEVYQPDQVASDINRFLFKQPRPTSFTDNHRRRPLLNLAFLRVSKSKDSRTLKFKVVVLLKTIRLEESSDKGHTLKFAFVLIKETRSNMQSKLMKNIGSLTLWNERRCSVRLLFWNAFSIQASSVCMTWLTHRDRCTYWLII